MLDVILDLLLPGLFPNLGHRGRSRRAYRKFLTHHSITLPAVMQIDDGTEQAGYLRVTDESIRLSLDRDGVYRPVEMAFDEFSCYSIQENARTRRQEPIIPGALRWWMVLNLTGPTGTTAVAYDSCYHRAVRHALDSAGVRESA